MIKLPEYLTLNNVPSPCFLLDERKLIGNLEIINEVQQAAEVQIILALKGFSMFHVFPLIKKYLKSATASSLHEAMLAEAYFGKVHTYAPAYKPDEFEQLMSLSSHISFNSLNQWEHFKTQVKKQNISCGLRINPEYSDVNTALYNPCIAGSRLGIRKELLKKLPEGIEGLHVHNLCESSAQALEQTLKEIESKFGHLLSEIKWLNLGGGHLMTHKDYDLKKLIQSLRSFKSRHPHLHIILEPGAAIAWQSGYLVSTVMDVMDSDGIQAVVLDASISAHMPDCIEMPYKPIVYNAGDAKKGETSWRLGGLTCLAGDFVGDYSFENGLKIGDKVIFDDMMHYTMVKTNTFNGVNLPHIGIWKTDDRYEHVKSFGFEDYKGRLS
jgi:carboxynorspermidine decarboxylase